MPMDCNAPDSRPVAKRARRADGPRLGRDDWLDAAFDAVAEGGFDGMRVLSIADTLGVTRGIWRVQQTIPAPAAGPMTLLS